MLPLSFSQSFHGLRIRFGSHKPRKICKGEYSLFVHAFTQKHHHCLFCWAIQDISTMRACMCILKHRGSEKSELCGRNVLSDQVIR